MAAKKSCCVFGYEKIEKKEKLRESLIELFDYLIRFENVYFFLLGEESEFDNLCSEAFISAKDIYPHIKKYGVEYSYEMIDNSDISVIYLKDGYLPPKSKMKMLYTYAYKKDKMIINLKE